MPDPRVVPHYDDCGDPDCAACQTKRALDPGFSGGVPPEYMDAVLAAAEIVGRSGGKQFELGWLYDDDEPPPGWPEGVSVPVEEQQWYATARYKGALLKGEGTWPWEACERLAAKILHGGKCISCGESVNLVPEQGQWSDGNCNWHRVGQHWVRGCDGGYGPLNERTGVSGFLYPTVFDKVLCPRCSEEMTDTRPARSQVKYGEKRTILICHLCGVDEYIRKQQGLEQVRDTEWPLSLKRLLGNDTQLSDDFTVALEGGSVQMSGTIHDPKIVALVQEEEARGTPPEKAIEAVLSRVLKTGAEGMKEMYGET